MCKRLAINTCKMACFPTAIPFFLGSLMKPCLIQKIPGTTFTNDDDHVTRGCFLSTSPSGLFRMIAFITFIHLKLIIYDNIRYVKNMPSPFLCLYCSIKFGRIFFWRLQALGVGSICGGRESRLKLRSLAAFTVSTSWPFGFFGDGKYSQMCCVDCRLVKYVSSPGLFVHLIYIYMYIYTVHISMCFNLLYGYKYTVFWNPANKEEVP